MYIFELIANAFRSKTKNFDTYNPLETPEDIIENSNNCVHFFMPIDSSNAMFACKYCGLVVPKEKLKNKNIFKQ